MKSIIRLLSLTLVMVLFFSAIPTLPVSAAHYGSTYSYIEVIKDGAPIRSKAAESGSVYAYAQKGSLLQTIGRIRNSAGNYWYKVVLDEKEVFIYSGNVKVNKYPSYQTINGKKYTLAYSASGCSNVPKKQTVRAVGSTVKIGSAHTQVDYKFHGWNFSSKLLQPGTRIVLSKNTTLTPSMELVWTMPTKDYWVSSEFGYRIHPISGTRKLHEGIDLAATTGTPIYATRSGTVTVAAYQAGGAGYYIKIKHDDTYSSVYMHMTHYIVKQGQYVQAGQIIGYVGSTGGSTGPHLHFGLAKDGVYINPREYLKF